MNREDLSIGIVLTAPSPATSGTTLVLESGQGGDMPAVPFKALVYPPGFLPTRYNAERVLVTNVSSDTLTITRAQGVTSAQAIDIGWILSNNFFADDLLDGSNTFVTKEVPTGLVNGSNTSFTTSGAYTGSTLEVYVNGLRQGISHVTETTPASGIFTLDVAPLTGDVVEVSYQTSAAASFNADTVDGFHASSTPAANTLMPLDSNAKLPQSAQETAILSNITLTSGFNTTSTTPVLVTGLTATITMPAGGKKLRISVYGDSMENNTVGGYPQITIWDGAVGSGTQIMRQVAGPDGGDPMPFNCVSPLQTPAPGASKTYSIGFNSIVTGTSFLNAQATYPTSFVIEVV